MNLWRFSLEVVFFATSLKYPMCISFELGCVLFDKMIQFILFVNIYTMEIFQHIKAKIVANCHSASTVSM